MKQTKNLLFLIFIIYLIGNEISVRFQFSGLIASNILPVKVVVENKGSRISKFILEQYLTNVRGCHSPTELKKLKLESKLEFKKFSLIIVGVKKCGSSAVSPL